ncbi:hypothetical protein [Streptomyces sp. NPDC091209]|uniref:hypothetical protein n=1 Tax=Streptomyces sp. NPDC091209 TaxID=3365974 RepID=UPI0038229DED
MGNHNVQHNEIHLGFAPSRADVLAAHLYDAVLGQWTAEAARRRIGPGDLLPLHWRVSSRPVGNRIEGAVAGGRTAFDPLPGLRATTLKSLNRGGGWEELHEVYGGLASGRLLLTGLPAAGKTTAAVHLLLEALAYREKVPKADRARVPVPVMFTLHGWDPKEQAATEWLAEKLSSEYVLPWGRDRLTRAKELLTSGRVAVFLDGLDEVPRPRVVLSALEATTFRLVVLSRARQAVVAGRGRRCRLGGAVALEVLPVPAEEAAAYLLNKFHEPAPPVWQELTRRVRRAPDSPLAQALSSPLAIRLLCDVYLDGGPVEDLFDESLHASQEAIENHLLSHLVRAAYTPREGYKAPPFSPETAVRTLRFIARRLETDGTRDLLWWHIPAWADRRVRIVLTAVVCGLLLVPGSTVLIGSALHTPAGPWIGALIGIVNCGAVAYRTATIGDQRALSSTRWRDIVNRSTVRFGLLSGLGTGLLLNFANPLPLLGIPAPSMWVSVFFAACYGFGSMLVRGAGREMTKATTFAIGSSMLPADEERPPAEMQARCITPRSAWRHHLQFRLPLGLLTGLAAGLGPGVLLISSYGPTTALYTAIGIAMWSSLWSGPVGNLACTTALASAQLALQEETPLRLMTFLEDARDRGVLRTVGPVYQFMHGRLQQCLAQDALAPRAGRVQHERAS